MESKVIIRKSENSVTGYELVVIENDNENVINIDATYKNEPFTLILPENPSNRKYFNSKKVDKNGGEIELTYKESRTLTKSEKSESTPRVSKSKLLDYLTEEELKIYEELMEKAEKRMKRESIKRQIAELEKELEGDEEV